MPGSPTPTKSNIKPRTPGIIHTGYTEQEPAYQLLELAWLQQPSVIQIFLRLPLSFLLSEIGNTALSGLEVNKDLKSYRIIMYSNVQLPL